MSQLFPQWFNIQTSICEEGRTGQASSKAWPWWRKLDSLEPDRPSPHGQQLCSLREETGKEKRRGSSSHEWLELPGSSPGRGEGLPIFLPLNGESWWCFHCAGQSDSLPNIGLHYCGLALIHFQPAKSTSTAKDVETSLLSIWPSAQGFINHRPYFLPPMAKGDLYSHESSDACHGKHSLPEKSSLYKILFQFSTDWCSTPVSQFNLQTVTLVLSATLWITAEEALTMWTHGKQYKVLNKALSKMSLRCLSGIQKWAFLWCEEPIAITWLHTRSRSWLSTSCSRKFEVMSSQHSSHVLCSYNYS